MKKLRKPRVIRRRFYNQVREGGRGFFLRSLRMMYRSHRLHKADPHKDTSCWIGPANPSSCSINPVVTWIGHSSFLIQVGGVNILVDPIFGNLSFMYRRILPPGLSVAQLPKIDFILISHNHIDHMDAESLLAVREKSPEFTVMVPQGDKTWFDKRRFVQSYEHTWWDQRSFPLVNDTSKRVTFTFLPAAHWSRRGFFDKNRSLWGSWMIECEGSQIYFAGDTCYSTHFHEIAQEFPDIDLALIPIGPCEPRDWLKEGHLGHEDAGRSFLELGAHNMIPMHWGTFSFGVEQFDAPVDSIQRWWKENEDQLEGKQLHCAKVGEAVVFEPGDATLKRETSVHPDVLPARHGGSKV